jgi:hypothetical protein
MPNSFAMWATFLPALKRRTASSGFARAVGFRHLYFPFACAFAMPSRVKSGLYWIDELGCGDIGARDRSSSLGMSALLLHLKVPLGATPDTHQ